ncbi:hypothetical protein SAMN05192558_10967 [Actinokineospora alba]|uniref:Uncharacterized protein n=1 Tax=Actinokineospora alba TaxID=504798 RepID=A0A1H0SRW0_9PSEU|nr:hypothetical protein [Actinokineospora alba]TDP66566.1 hypothetical protein C8E96_2077 [Actinokineospora alba]SDJ37910.1 hypothetical protein SAMN05421871_11479 [Actinokineospora alba]SDP44507.1 hypothetical protein SAMN05192558_10967 [Actinokineospora alba]
MKKAIVWTTVIALVAFMIGLDAGWWSSSDNDTTIPTLSEADGNDLVARLAKAEKAHGICYGWEVDGGSSKPVTSGSSRGIDISAKTCGRYAILTTDINYTSASSESEDSASVTVRTSTDLPYLFSGDLSRVGVDTAALLEEPTTATAYGALALPLLLVEKGVVQPLEPEAASAQPATAIGHPGSDFAASHRGAIISLSIFGGLALIGLVVGFILRRKRSQEG